MALGLSSPAVSAQFRILDAALDGAGRPEIRFEADPLSYFLLYRGDRVTGIDTPAAAVLGGIDPGLLKDQRLGVSGGFYRVRQVPLGDPLDVDGDGIDDVYELRHPSLLDPLNPADAGLDADGDGLSNLEEYRRGSDPAVINPTTLISSPANGEQAVSVNRETVIRFSQPLAAGTTLTLAQFHALFAGRQLLGRVELASDLRSATLFHLEPLPASARIRVTLDATALKDRFNRAVDADGDGQPGGIALIDFDTASGTIVPGTAVIGRVFASELVNGTAVNNPLPGVRVTVDGQEQTLFAVTDGLGSFKLDPAPAGEFFVHIDGRTSPQSNWPNGAYYPVVGKKWTAVAGKTDNLAGGSGEIYLPRIEADALQAVSEVLDTTIQLPAKVLQDNPQLAGVEITVPANSLFNDAGGRGGRVGLAPVSPDRLPQPLPPGLRLPLVITVQTDGAQNFDRPAPVRFPNLPDPLTGALLPPGAKTGLWSFNHDTGRWELQGTATITADGKFAESDPGVGILQPGWHGLFSAVFGGGTKAGAPPPPLTWPQIAGLLGADYSSKVGSAAEGLAFQIMCIASNSCLAQTTWGGGFVQRTFSDTALNTVNGVQRLPNLALPGAEWLCDYLPKWLPIGGGITAGEACSVLNGFGHHFAYDLLPSFAKYCTLLNPPQHDAFFTNAVLPCFTANVAAGNMSAWAGSAANVVVPPSAAALRDTMMALCPVLKFLGIAREGPQPAGPGDFPPIPPPLKAEDLFDPALQAIFPLRVDTGGQFFVNVGTTLQFHVFRRTPNGEVEVSRANQGSLYLAAVGDGTVVVTPDGLVRVLGTLGPLVNMTPVVYVVVRNGDDFGVAQLAVRDVDSDGDLISDSVEVRFGLDPQVRNGPNSDLDGDGLSDLQEVLIGTQPLERDTDGDGIDDGTEVRGGLDPLSPSGNSLETQGGLHYWMAENLATGTILRGQAGDAGSIPDGLILAPNAHYRLSFLHAATLRIGSSEFVTPGAGQRFTPPAVALLDDSSKDTDNDQLTDRAEAVLGTDANKADTDNDGVPDGAEVRQGTNPTDGLAVRTGIIYTAATPGNAVDICTLNDMAILALENAGIAVFNIFNGLNPTLIAQVNTPGTALRVACAGRLAAVADNSAGLAVIDLTDPPAARITHQVDLGGAALSVAAAGGVALVGTAAKEVVAVDLISGVILSRARLDAPVRDVATDGDFIYALTDTQLHVLDFSEGTLTLLASSTSPVFAVQNSRLFVGGDIAYAVQNKGYNTFDLGEPSAPALILARNTTSFGWKQIVVNGSGLGLAAVSPNLALDGPHHVSLYDVGDPAAPDKFLTEFLTPGISRAVSIYGGLGYVADGPGGLVVINYLAYDRNGIPPQLTLDSPPADGAVEEGKSIRVSVTATDDVQVHSVELYVDGERVQVDGNFPFEFHVTTPLIGPGRTSFRLSARALDTGGNATWSEERVLPLVHDQTPPRVRRTIPFNGALVGGTDSLAIFFSEPLNDATITPQSIRLLGAGPDNQFGTADDVQTTSLLEWRPSVNAVFLHLGARLGPGLYRLIATTDLRDLSGNPLLAESTSTFRIFSFTDLDGDGLPDELEPSLGYDPTKADTDGDGISDGDEDPDNDGLINAWEILAGTDPKLADTNGNGRKDGDEDADGDGLTNRQEAAAGTLPLQADTDGDGWNDETEITGGSDPLNPLSQPRLFVVGTSRVGVGRSGFEAGGAAGSGFVIGAPRVSVIRTGFDASGVGAGGVVIARPPVSVGRTGFGPDPGEAPSTIIAKPPLSILIPAP
jgi:hypothetical protein